MSGRWRQPYLLLVELSWWRFLALVTALYLLINLLFASLYLLDPAGIGGTGSSDLPLSLRAFFLSVETLATIGYGSLYPDSLWVHLVTTGEAITGLILVALITGLAFARFARTPQSVEFAEQARIEAHEGRACLVIRLHNSRPNTLFDVRVRVFWQPPDGDRQLQPLPLLTPDGLPLLDDLRLLHPLENGGPLVAIGRDPAAGGGELLVSFSGMDATLERPIHLVHRYPASAIVRVEPAEP
ncbi:MAG: potassium transporter [Cyanobium sp. PLM2.Bin73]|nr:MAG: potassium transporter [Cyanobium sp. PLM2.Bin73]